VSLVARVHCADYAQCRPALERALALLGGAQRFAAPGEPLLIKPNLLAAHPPEAAVTTHPAVVDTLLSIARDLGARPVVADSPGIGSLERVARAAGVLEVCRRHDAPLLDLGASEPTTVNGAVFRGIELARDALEARRIWNVPKWKTHSMMGLTLGIKNLYGCIPGKRKIALHFRAGKDPRTFGRLLVDLWLLLRPALTVLDGVRAMEGPGPSRGRPVARNLFLASADAPALDWEAARLSGFSPASVPSINESLSRGLVRPDDIAVTGDPADPLRFATAPGSPADFAVIPAPLRRLLHSVLSPPPRFDPAHCTGCGVCVESCPAGTLRFENGETSPRLSREACIRCYCCQELCPQGAVGVPRRFRARAGGAGRGCG
jgi:uncharacterized protein (DUF362 family)/NAD-dependent dihydropyrimidine dehydrogenase PreA subunit